MSECEWVWAQCPMSATQKPPAMHIVPRLSRKRGGARGTPRVHPTPWQCTLSHACHAKEAEPEGRQGVHLTPWQCPRLPRKRGGARGTPGHTSDPLAVHIVPRLPRKRGGARGTPGRTSDPLAAHIVPRLPRKRGGARGTPGRTSDPLAVHIVPRPATQKKAEPEGHQGVHPTPWQRTLSEWVSEWVGGWVGGRGRAWVGGVVWVGGWVSEWVCVCEGGGREGGGGGRGADTELKTKTPHVNVGKNEAILRDFLQKWKVACSADGLVPMCFAIFPVHLSKLLCLPRKSDARSYEVLHLSRKITTAKPEDLRQIQPLSGNQRPDLLTALMKMSLVLRLPRKMHLCRSSSNAPRLPSFLEMAQNPHVLLTFWEGAQSLAPATQNDIWTSKSGPNPLCFVHCDFEMCFARQRRAFFRHLNFQKWSEPGVLCTFLTWKCASRHNGCNFSSLIWPAGSAPAAISEPTFWPPGATNHWKKRSVSRLSYLFLHLHLLSSDSFSSLIFSLLLFSSLWLFPSLLFICPYVGSLTSKLPLIIVRIPKLLPQVISNISRQVLAATTPFFKGAVHKSVSATFQNTTVFPDCFQ